MKLRATKQEMREGYDKILRIGYCNAQNLLNYEQPFAYSAGRYGWCCDYYDIDGVLISTGYSPIESKGMKLDYARLREYEERAGKIRYSDAEWEIRRKQTRELLRGMLREAERQMNKSGREKDVQQRE